MRSEIERCFEFITEVEKLKSVMRKTRPAGLGRFENSAEHSWQIALLGMVLAGYSDEPVDVGRVVMMLLVHDIGEIDADDVYFFDDAAKAAARDAERNSVERIFGLLPEDAGKELLELWEEFEHGDTPEAKFARAVDRVMPILQNLNNGRQSWKENNVTQEQILLKTAYIGDASAEVWEMIRERIVLAFEEG